MVSWPGARGEPRLPFLGLLRAGLAWALRPPAFEVPARHLVDSSCGARHSAWVPSTLRGPSGLSGPPACVQPSTARAGTWQEYLRPTPCMHVRATSCSAGIRGSSRTVPTPPVMRVPTEVRWAPTAVRLSVQTRRSPHLALRAATPRAPAVRPSPVWSRVPRRDSRLGSRKARQSDLQTAGETDPGLPGPTLTHRLGWLVSVVAVLLAVHIG